MHCHETCYDLGHSSVSEKHCPNHSGNYANSPTGLTINLYFASLEASRSLSLEAILKGCGQNVQLITPLREVNTVILLLRHKAVIALLRL